MLGRPSSASVCLRLPLTRQASSSERIFPIRKRFLYESYTHLLASNSVCLFFRHDSLTPLEWKSLRGQLKKLRGAAVDSTTINIQVLRTGLLAPVIRRHVNDGTMSKQTQQLWSSRLRGPICALYQNKLNPPQLDKALNILSNASTKSGGSVAVARLPFVVGWIEGQSQEEDEVTRMAKLPSLTQLHGHIVGLVQMSGQRVVQTLQQAAGGQVVTTLDGAVRAGMTSK